MPSTEPAARPRALPIALVYQQQALHEHLKTALSELGAQVVYDSPAERFSRADLDASGARVVVINLDPDVDAELAQFDDLLTDDSLRVVFNDGEVSSRLQGWDQARWARHLAAKILGVGDINPPRPPGAQAVPVRVKSEAREGAGAVSDRRDFQLEGTALADALAADTGESLQRTRAALITSDEPIAAQLVDSFASSTPRPVPKPEDATASDKRDAPTLELPSIAVTAAIEREFIAPSSNNTISDLAPEMDLTDELSLDAGDLDLDVDGMAVADIDDDGLSLGEPPVAIDIDDDELGVAQIGRAETTSQSDFDPDKAEYDDSVTAAPSSEEASVGLDADFEATLREFGLMEGTSLRSTVDTGGDSVADAVSDVDNEFGAALGALSLEPIDGEIGRAASGVETPVAGLDDLLSQLEPGESLQAANNRAASINAAGQPSAPPPPASVAEQTPAATGNSSTAATTEPPKRRSLSDFDLSALSLAPLGDEPDKAPIAGRAQYAIDEKDRTSAAPKAKPRETPSGLRPVAGLSADPGEALEFDLGNPSSVPVVHGTFAAEAATGLRNVWVLGASIGGPEAVREFLAALPADIPAVFLLVQHMGADFMDLMVQQVSRASAIPVVTLSDGDLLAHGQVVVVPLVERVLLDATGVVRLVDPDEPSQYSPSIDRVMHDVADRFGSAAGAIVFSGMAHDAIEGAVYMREHGGTIWVQDPATCVISSMVDGAQEAGVVSFVGSPVELAAEFIAEMARRG